MALVREVHKETKKACVEGLDNKRRVSWSKWQSKQISLTVGGDIEVLCEVEFGSTPDADLKESNRG
jgi:hypothetical protein